MQDGIHPTFPANASPAGATDNPGDEDVAGRGVETETGAPVTGLLDVPDQDSDNTVDGSIPSSGGGGHLDKSADPSGGVTITEDGLARQHGEDETLGTMNDPGLGMAPDHFPGQ